MKYKIFFDKNINNISKFVQELKSKLNDFEEDDLNFDFAFILGGDGTFLRYASKIIQNDVKIVFINVGTLGFYSYTNKISKINIKKILQNKNYQKLKLLKITDEENQWYAINDFSLNSTYAINIEIFINKVLLEKIKGNGVLVSTPMGSTARNKSLNGPILLPNLNVLCISEVEPINNRFYNSLNSSIVIDDQNTITIKSKNYKKYSIIVDGEVIERTKNTETINITSTYSKAQVLINTDIKSWVKKLNYSFRK